MIRIRRFYTVFEDLALIGGPRLNLLSTVFGILALIGMLVTPWMALVGAGVEQQMGIVQKIMYYHVPSAFMMYLGFFVCFVFSILYLWKRNKQYDIWASSSAEVGLLFCVLVLLSGPIWAKPIWNAWWVWDPQLTLVFVLFLIFVAYAMLKSYSEESIQSAKFRAVLGIIGFLDAPLIHYSVKLWRTHHPAVVRGDSSGLPPDMETALLACTLTWLALFCAILFRRVSVEMARDELDYLKAEIQDRKAILGQMAT